MIDRHKNLLELC